MLPIEDALKIMGAAEGSWYFNTYSKKWVDLRYTPVFAGPGSGLSFGVYQHDTHADLLAPCVIAEQAVARLGAFLSARLQGEKLETPAYSE